MSERVVIDFEEAVARLKSTAPQTEPEEKELFTVTINTTENGNLYADFDLSMDMLSMSLPTRLERLVEAFELTLEDLKNLQRLASEG